MSVCLDAWAVLAWLDGEQPALARVQETIESRPVVSWVNLVEVYYRVHDRSRALEGAHLELAGRLLRRHDRRRPRTDPPNG